MNIYYRKNNNSNLFNQFDTSNNGFNNITKMQNYIPIYKRIFNLQ